MSTPTQASKSKTLTLMILSSVFTNAGSQESSSTGSEKRSDELVVHAQYPQHLTTETMFHTLRDWRLGLFPPCEGRLAAAGLPSYPI